MLAKIDEQKNAITKLFQRLLRLPLLGMEDTVQQYPEWCVARVATSMLMGLAGWTCLG